MVKTMGLTAEQNSVIDIGIPMPVKCKLETVEAMGIVSNIQQFTIHDGPGIRTEVFLKGCPLNCVWCSNPESLKPRQEIGVHASRCIGIDKCGYCLAACSECEQGVFLQMDNKITGIDREKCTDCMQCFDACPAGAIVLWGEMQTVDDVMKVIMSDIAFYEKSGGGVTISGGEALVQWQFAKAILKNCKQRDIHTCLESALHCNPSILEEVYPHVDLIITDIKHMDDEQHKKYTGLGNSLIHSNIKSTVEMRKPLIIRIPVIPDHNNSEENIRATAEFISKDLQNKVLQVQLLPYRPLGLEKYQSLGLDYPMADFIPPTREVWELEILNFVQIMKSYGIPVVAGANSKMG